MHIIYICKYMITARAVPTEERKPIMQSRFTRSLSFLLIALLLTSLLPVAAFATAEPSVGASAAEEQTVTPGTGTPETGEAADDAAGGSDAPTVGVTADTATQKEVASIEIETVGKDEYYEGEYFDPSLFVLHVTYTDGSDASLRAGEFAYSPAGRLVTDGISEDVTIEFSCGNKVKRTYITVHRPTMVRMISFPVKLQYNEGASFDRAGIILELTYADGTVRIPEDDEYTVELPTALTPGITSGEINCYGAKTTITGLNVIKMVSMQILRAPQKTVYYEGEAFDPTGMQVIGTFENSIQGRMLDPSEYTISGSPESLTPTSADRRHATLTLSVGTISVDVEITVIGFESFKITRPYKTDYYYGDVFSAEGLNVKAQYVNGDERDITSEMTIDAPRVMQAGSEVRIKFLSYEESLLTVHEMRYLHFKTLPSKRTFKEGDKLTADLLPDMLITGEYDDGTEVPLSAADYTITPSAPLTINDSTMTINYLGLMASVGITVQPARAISKIEIKERPAVTEYISNQPIDITGLVVVAVYEDGTRETIPTEQLQFNPAPGSSVKVTDTSIKITYKLSDNLVYTARQNITVSPKKVISLSILTAPSKLTYVEGEVFDTTGMEILAVYNDGTSAKVTTYTCSPTDELTIPAGLAEATVGITISYVDCSATQNVTVKRRDVSSIEVAETPTKLEYTVGESFDPAGLILKVNYADGATKLIEYAASPAEIALAPEGSLGAEDKAVTLTYRGLTLDIPITVKNAEPTVTDTDTEPTTEPTDPAATSEPTIVGDETTAHSGNMSITTSSSTIMVVWIAIIAVIALLLIVLVIYYKRNFT